MIHKIEINVMTSKFSNQVISSINNDIPWNSWPETARCALASSLSPAISMSEHQKGASEEEWETIRLMRHLFNRGRLPVPSFIIKQWESVPESKKNYWIEIGRETRSLVLEKTKRRVLKPE